MPTEVKICGLSDEEGVDAALEAGADFLGFVFFPPSPRNVAPARAAALAERARGKAQLVALTVDGSDVLLDEISVSLRPDLLQLHGTETPERMADIRRRGGRAVMKVLSVAESADLSSVGQYADADRLLLDAKLPKDATRPGGYGVRFDWSILGGFAPGMPWLLAGGLNPTNVAEALSISRATGVDVSSGVETAPGKKSPELIHAFVAAVRAFDLPAQKVAAR
jgi:phosphoribosylanthranilate isomerase